MKNKTRSKKIIKLCEADRQLIHSILNIGEDGDIADVIGPIQKLSPAGRIALAEATINQIYSTALDVLPSAKKAAAHGALLLSSKKRRKAKRICGETRDLLRRKIAA